MGWYRPCADVPQVVTLAETLFNLQLDRSESNGSVKELVSYDDQNFYLKCVDGREYILKIHNAEAMSILPVLQAHNRVMRHLETQHVITCMPAGIQGALPTLQTGLQSGFEWYDSDIGVYTLQYPVECSDVDSCNSNDVVHRKHPIRLFKWLHGRTLGSADQTPQLHAEVGRFVGRVSKALSICPRQPSLDLSHDWKMECCHEVISRKLDTACQVLDHTKRSLILDLLADWKKHEPQLQALPCQLCHSDANESNLLVDEEGTKVVGLIDFGDMCYSWAATEIANCMVYSMLLRVPTSQDSLSTSAADGTINTTPQQVVGGSSTASVTVDENDLNAAHEAFSAGRRILAGFLTERELTAAEVASVPLLVRARLATSLVNGACAMQRDPGNAEYVSMTQVPGWKLMQWLSAAERSGISWHMLQHS